MKDSRKIEIMDDDAKVNKPRVLFKQKKRRLNRCSKLLIMGCFLNLAVGTRGIRKVRRREICEIPPDVISEILIKLPLISLKRSMCVSKQWSSLISSEYFRHQRQQQQSQQCRLYMSLVDKSDQRVLLPSEACTVFNNNNSSSSSLVMDNDLSIPGMGGFYMHIHGGLICYSRKNKACVYNPSTKQFLTFPAIKSNLKKAQQDQQMHFKYYIGHDSNTDKYKLFCTVSVFSDYLYNLKSEHWVLVLEAGSLWKKIVLGEYYWNHAPLILGWSTIGSVVYYMAWCCLLTCVIVSFDFRSEKLNITLIPYAIRGAAFAPLFTVKADVIKYGGKVTVFDYTNLEDKGFVDLWTLEEDAAAGTKEWSRERLVLQPCQRHLVDEIKLIVKDTTRDGKVILAPEKICSPFYLLCYDLQRNNLRRVEVKGIPQHWFDKRKCCFDIKLMDESDNFIYFENLTKTH